MRGTIAAPASITCRSRTAVQAREAMQATDLGKAIAAGDLAKFRELRIDNLGAARREAEAEMNVAGGWMIDFFAVDQRIAHVVLSIEVCLELGSSPHNSVVLRLRSTATRDMVRMLRRPRPFPGRRLVGCCRYVAPPTEATFLRTAHVTEADLDGFFREFHQAAERGALWNE